GGNRPPIKPSITGPATGKINVTIAYNFTTIDPDGDEVSYYIDWGDGTYNGWTSFVPSGTTVTLTHTWGKRGTYLIRAKAKDVYGAESEWGTLVVKMPIVQQNILINNQQIPSYQQSGQQLHSSFLLKIFEQLQNL
ncbi:MAG: PKD domain-containing protein, partial [Candidatus Thermoplasmatota archaeon]|nr:PKD domain-containing protein [Candidatus Thermoplasmatota archaeon]